MAKIALRVDECGKLDGLTPADARAYAKFKRKLGLMQPGDTISFEHRFPRSPKFHRLHMKMWGALFDAQEQFSDPYQLRKWGEVGAGHCDFVPGPAGCMYALARSISYESLDDAEFYEHHIGVIAFLRSEYAHRFLWPFMTPTGSSQMMESVLEGFA